MAAVTDEIGADLDQFVAQAWPRSIQNNLLIIESESAHSGSNLQLHPANAGIEADASSVGEAFACAGHSLRHRREPT